MFQQSLRCLPKIESTIQSFFKNLISQFRDSNHAFDYDIVVGVEIVTLIAILFEIISAFHKIKSVREFL